MSSQTIRSGPSGLSAAPSLGGVTSANGSGPLTTGTTPATSGPAAVDPRASETAPGALPTAGPSAIAPVRGPLKLGFINTTFANADEYGFTGSGHSTQQIYSALVDALNSRGGLAGRKIEPVYAGIDFGSANYSSDFFQAMCSKFTEDNRVVAVPTYTILWNDSFESCVNKAGVVRISGYLVGDNKSQRHYPYLFGTAYPTLDRAYLLQLSAAMASGRLTKASEIGVIRSECPHDLRAWDNATAPFIKKHGLNEAVTQLVSCPSGPQGIGTILAEIQGAVLRFQQGGVDTVIPGGGANQYFAKQDDSQRYYPQYLISSFGDAADLEGAGNSVPESQLKNFHGFGWFPTNDIDPAHRPPAPAAQRAVRDRCLSLLRSRGIVMTEYVEIKVAYTTCDALFLFEAAPRATSGHTDSRLVRDVVLRLETTFTSVSTLNGRPRLAPGQRDATAAWRSFNWQSSCACLLYDGAEHPMPVGAS